MSPYPLIGVSKEALEFEEKNKDKIKATETEVMFDFEEKKVTFELTDGTKHEYVFPLSKIVKWSR